MLSYVKRSKYLLKRVENLYNSIEITDGEKMIQGYGMASGKVILMGEHSVVYGMPAIALPFLDKGVECYVQEYGNGIFLETTYYNGDLDDSPELLWGIKHLIIETLRVLNKEDINLKIIINSRIPAQRGLGSSAAVSVAVVRALFDAFEIKLNDDNLSQLVHIAESIHHTDPSGLDAKTILSGKPIYFKKDTLIEEIEINFDGVMVIADTGVKGQTKQAVQGVKQIKEKNYSMFEETIENIGLLTEETRVALGTNEIEKVGVAMTQTQSLLQKLQVSDHHIEKLVRVAMKYGAEGAKLTGGGKGGCIIALCKDGHTANNVSEKLLQNGAKATWIYDMKEKGMYE